MIEFHLHDGVDWHAPKLERVNGITVIHGTLVNIDRDSISGLDLDIEEKQEALAIWGEDAHPRRYQQLSDEVIVVTRAANAF